MKKIRNFFEEHDVDELFAYKTTKVVKIRDRYLGWLHMFFQLAILGYIVGYVIIHQKLYLAKDHPIAAVRVRLDEPDVIADLTALDYCKQADASLAYQCQYMDVNDIVFPPDLTAGIFITTRVTTRTEKIKAGCMPPVSNKCKLPWSASGNLTAFVANVGNFILRVDHSVRAPEWYHDVIGHQVFKDVPDDTKYTVAGSSRALEGRLLDQQGKVVKTFDEPNTEDRVTLTELLKAADITSLSNPTVKPGSKESIRYDGLILMVEISYHNKYTPKNLIHYDYKVTSIPETVYNVIEKIYTKFPAERALRNRHGVRILFVPSGGIYMFNFQLALVQMTASLGLLAVASQAVDFVATKMMPQKAHYQACKFQKSADFSDLRDRIEEQKKRETDLKSKRQATAEKYGTKPLITR